MKNNAREHAHQRKLMLRRLAAVKKAADAANRRLCFVGMSLNTYLEAAANENQAPFSPKELIHPSQLDEFDPNDVMVVTTGSQVSFSFLCWLAVA